MNSNFKIMILPVLCICLMVISCKDAGSVSGFDDPGKKGFYVEEAAVVIPRLHGFENLSPVLADTRELILMRKDDSYISIGKMEGILDGTNMEEYLTEMFYIAQDRYNNGTFLLGVSLMHGSLEKVKNPNRPYVDQLIIAERPEGSNDRLTPTDLMLHKHEIERLPEGRKMIVEVFFTVDSDTLYIFNFISPVEDYLFHRQAAFAIFNEMQLNVTQRPAGY